MWQWEHLLNTVKTFEILGTLSLIRSKCDNQWLKSHKSRCQDEAHAYPSTGVADQADEERGQLGSAHLGGCVVGHHHEALRTGLSHPPHTIRAELKELWDLPKHIKSCYSNVVTRETVLLMQLRHIHKLMTKNEIYTNLKGIIWNP